MPPRDQRPLPFMSEPANSARPRPAAALAAATVMSLPLGSIYAFSVLLAPLEQLLQVSRSELASVFGISTVFFTIGANLAPRLFGCINAPLLVAATAALAAFGVALAAAATSLAMLIAGYGMLFSAAGGMAYVVVQQCVNAAPLSRPGLVNGYLVSLFPLGAMLAAPAFGLGVDGFGVRATLAGLAVSVVATGLAATLLIARSAVVLAKPGAITASAVQTQTNMRPVFWKIFTVFFLAAAAGLTVLSQAAGMVAAYGAGKTAALLATTGITAAIAAARLAGGWLIDRFPVPFVAASAQAIAFLGAIALTLLPSPATAILALAMIGVGYGLISGVTAGAVASYWPKSEFGRIASKTYVAWCLAALSLPLLAARLFDLTGGYETAVIVAGGANLLAVLVALTLPRQQRRTT